MLRVLLRPFNSAALLVSSLNLSSNTFNRECIYIPHLTNSTNWRFSKVAISTFFPYWTIIKIHVLLWNIRYQKCLLRFKKWLDGWKLLCLCTRSENKWTSSKQFNSSKLSFVDKAFIFSRWMVSTKGWYKSVSSCVI